MSESNETIASCDGDEVVTAAGQPGGVPISHKPKLELDALQSPVMEAPSTPPIKFVIEYITGSMDKNYPPPTAGVYNAEMWITLSDI